MLIDLFCPEHGRVGQGSLGSDVYCPFCGDYVDTTRRACNETRPDATRGDELTAPQMEAVALVVSGCPVAEIAERIGVNRATVWRWRRLPPFIAAVNDARRELDETSHAQLQALVPLALDVLSERLHDGDVKVALALITGSGLLAPQDPASSDPAVVDADLRRVRAEAETAALSAESAAATARLSGQSMLSRLLNLG